jgi:hypothetical protein
MASANVTNTYVVPESTKVSPYYDDFSEDKNFHRILFRPGYAVQARELTQIQTILQNQVERFGRHIFTNGSSVIGGDVLIPEETHATINLEPKYGTANNDIRASDFRDKTIVLSTNPVNGPKFRVLTTTEGNQSDPPSLYGTFIAETGFGEGATIKVDGESTFANLASANSVSYSKLAFLRDSIFFYNGYFVKVPKQVAVIGKYEDSPTCKVGLEFDDNIVTEDSDTTLLDPAQESSNYQAPGAARYKMDLTLTTRPLESSDDSKFIELARVESGSIKKIIRFPVYSEIEEVFARRTYDESGNYTVKPFIISFDTDRYSPTTHVRSLLTPGKAYILGYEYETISDSEVRIPKARTKRDITGFDLNMNYGNYVIVDNLNGLFDLSQMTTFDIHCVPQRFVDYTSNNSYQTTKIGTGRVRDIEFYSGDIDVSARKYEFYLFDTKYRSITANAASITANTTTFEGSATKLSANNNAYVGAKLRVVTGPGSGYSYDVIGYNGGTKTLSVSPNFFETPTTNSILSLEFDFAESESFVISRTYTPGATANANTNITTLSKIGNDANGSAYVLEPSLNTLLFTLPEQYVSSGITNASYRYRKKFESIDFNAGVSDIISAATNEQFIGSTVTSNTASSVMDNFLIVVTDKKGSARSNGDIIKATVSISGTPEQATFNTGNSSINDTFSSVIFAKMETDSGIAPKIKTFVQANTITMSSETATMVTGSPTGSTANVYLNAAQVIISNPTRKVGVSESLYISDVVGIQKIYDLNGAAIPEGGTVLAQFDDVTERFELDSGQRDTHYDHASIRLKPNWPSCRGPLLVCAYYYNHSIVAGGGGYFSVDSYPNLAGDIFNDGKLLGDGYSVIPTYTKSTGEIVELRDSIDFRPVRTNASSATPNYTLYGAMPPVATTDFQLDYSYYLGRRDLIILTANRTIERVEGVPSKFPQDPTVPNRTMVLYSLGIPPYTKTPQDIKVKYIDNRRYTMRDIGKIDKRVETLEYYVSLNNLEKKAVDMSITDVNGLERSKYGIFADSFTGHVLGNSNLEDYKCAMNFEEGYLQCQANTTGFALGVNTALGTGVTIHRDKITLTYNEVELLSQKQASKDAPVAEFMFAVYDGNIITLPEADIWKSTNVDPDIIVTDTNTTEYTSVEVYQSVVNSQRRA